MKGHRFWCDIPMKSKDNEDAMETAKAGDRVTFHYTCKLDDGSVFATTRGKEPLEFVIGNATIIPGLQEAVIGMCPGETKMVMVPPEKSYGPYHEEMTGKVDRSMVPKDLELELGICIRIQHGDGQESDAFVTEINDDTVSVDGNHPLAGKNLNMEIELLELSEE